MTGVRYLDYETVVEINAAHCGDGAGVRDEAGIRAALGRAAASFGGYDLYPTIVEKAATILHGLSSTQYFHDGNKRTAWLTTKLFLALNGHILSSREDVEVESFVLAIATRAFERDGEADRGLLKAAEWFVAARRRATERHIDSFLSTEANFDRSAVGLDVGTLSARGAFVGVYELTADLPTFVQVHLTTQVHGFRDDAGRSIELEIDVYPEDEHVAELAMPSTEAQRRLEEDAEYEIQPGDLARSLRVTLGIAPAISTPRLVNGVHPVIYSNPLILLVHASGSIRLRLFIDGELARTFPLRITAGKASEEVPPPLSYGP